MEERCDAIEPIKRNLAAESVGIDDGVTIPYSCDRE